MTDRRANIRHRSAQHGNRILLVVALALLVALAGAACSSDDANDFPTGKFYVPDGIEGMEFNDDGTCRNFHDVDGWDLHCKYATNGDLYTEMWFDWPEGPKFPATYYWSYGGEHLTFELWGEDDNAFRNAFYTGGLTKSE